MTNKEAVQILKTSAWLREDEVRNAKRHMAIGMAIEALNCSEIPNGSDCISRQDAIDAAEKIIERDSSDNVVVNAMIAWSEYIKHLPSAESEQRWIPCNERLPDKEGHYLVTDYAGGVYAIDIDDFFYYEDGESDWMFSQNVIAWMPLPEPYKDA